jgi:hypothetical protein
MTPRIQIMHSAVDTDESRSLSVVSEHAITNRGLAAAVRSFNHQIDWARRTFGPLTIRPSHSFYSQVVVDGQELAVDIFEYAPWFDTLDITDTIRTWTEAADRLRADVALMVERKRVLSRAGAESIRCAAKVKAYFTSLRETEVGRA